LSAIHNTKFEPVSTDDTYYYFKYVSIADGIYPLDSDDAERIRMRWLETWLSNNSLGSEYKIVSRIFIFRQKGVLWGEGYDIYYLIAIPRQ